MQQPSASLDLDGYFVDWISISQFHGTTPSEAAAERLAALDACPDSVMLKDLAVPEVFSELRLVYDASGDVSHETARAQTMRASYDSSLQIRSHAGWVSVSGNPSRWGRPDNLFGYDLATCVEIINEELSRHNLPPFTPGVQIWDQDAEQIRDDLPPTWTGARISRIDITRNYIAGSDWLARLAMRAYAQKGRARMKRAVWADETALWHTGRRCVKAYLKGPEMGLHAKHSAWTQWATDNGLVRHELELRSKLLSETRLRYLGNLDMGKLIALHERETAHLHDIDATLDPMAVEHISPKSRLVYAAWLRGEPVKELMTRATFYRHRKVIMDEAGVDIGEQRSTSTNVVHLPSRTVSLRPAIAPAEYWGVAA